MTQRVLPRRSLGKASADTSGPWPGLVRFLGDPKTPLDTNGVERAARRRRGKEESLREPVRAGHPRRGAVLLADRVGQAGARRTPSLPQRGSSSRDPESGHRGATRDPK